MNIENSNKKNFGETERSIAKWLKKYPWIKQILKKAYQFISWLIHKKSYKYKTNYSVKLIKEKNDESFFGYYDKSPVSPNGKYILFCSTSELSYKKPEISKPIFVIVKDIKTNSTLLQIPAYAYNWQQGCRAHWLADDFFVFNDFDTENRKYITRLWSVSSSSEVKIIDWPVQDSYKAEYFLSINYQRIITLRPDYGYRNLPILNNAQLKNIANDGIWKVDYKTGESILLISLSDIYTVKTNSIMEKAFHKVNHLMISPFGNKFIFVHRYYFNKRRFDRLFSADSKTGAIKLVSDYEMVSHYSWIDNNNIIAYLRDSEGKDSYRIINIDTGNFSKVINTKLDSLGDGHPHVYSDWFITDTYPDRARMQHLILLNWKTGEMKELGEFFHGLKYSGETRCDLHPRFSPNGKNVFFDSVFSGKRQLYQMEINI
jgi:hypothetical protein